jgi:hypothetical protein
MLTTVSTHRRCACDRHRWRRRAVSAPRTGERRPHEDQDGQPFGRLAIVPDLNQGAEAIYGFRPGRSRFTFTRTLDARIEKTMRLGRTRIIGALDIFNLLNMAEEVEEDVATGMSFRTPTALQSPHGPGRPSRRVLTRYFTYCPGLASNFVLQTFEQK